MDGPSAGAAIFLAILSAIQERPVPQDVAITGELSIQGRIRGVGGIVEKIYGARQAGMRRVIVPAENKSEVPAGLQGVEIIPVATVEEMLQHIFGS